MMQIIRFFTLILFGLCGAAIGSAQAQKPDLFFYPAAAWEVQKAGLAGRDHRCALATKLNNGFVINLTGRGGAFQSMSIDFQQPAFDNRGQYTVTISVPDAQKRSFNAVSVNKQILDIDMTSAPDMLSSMRTKGVFDLSLQQNSFRFYLTGFAEAMNRYDDCTGHQDKAPVQQASVSTNTSTNTSASSNASTGRSAAIVTPADIPALRKKPLAPLQEIAPPPPAKRGG